MGFAGYFLIVAEFIGWAKERGIPVGPGRGSGAGSVAAWALGITDLDPLRFGLLSSASSIPSACRCRTSTSTSPGPAGRGHSPRAEVRPRSSGPDHHLRQAAGGARRAARRRPCDGAALRPSRQDLQAGAEQPRQPGEPRRRPEGGAATERWWPRTRAFPGWSTSPGAWKVFIGTLRRTRRAW